MNKDYHVGYIDGMTRAVQLMSKFDLSEAKDIKEAIEWIYKNDNIYDCAPSTSEGE